MNVIGMLKFPTQKTDRLWVEQMDPASLLPQDLHQAQLARRLSATGAPKVPQPPTNLSAQ
jgi:hypothetical protein